jgi:hypothetical protein
LWEYPDPFNRAFLAFIASEPSQTAAG